MYHQISKGVLYAVLGFVCVSLTGCLSSGSSGGATAYVSPASGGWEGFAVRLTGDVTTDANGDPTQVGNVNIDGPSPVKVKVTTDQNGNPTEIIADYNNGTQTGTLNQNCQSYTGGGGGVCEDASGNSLDYETVDAAGNTYQYLAVGSWTANLPANQTVNGWWGIDGVVGETTQQMPTSGTATYRGSADIAGVSTSNPVNVQSVEGDATFNVDFGNGSVSGTINNFRDDNNQAVNGNLAVNATINGNQLAGSVSGDIGPVTGITGTAKGAFFGPNAEEMGGAMSLQANGYIGGGTFVAKKQQTP